jgi:hypothetical protein
MRFFNEFVGKIPIRKMQCYVTIMVFDIKGGISKFKLIFFYPILMHFLGQKYVHVCGLLSVALISMHLTNRLYFTS